MLLGTFHDVMLSLQNLFNIAGVHEIVYTSVRPHDLKTDVGRTE